MAGPFFGGAFFGGGFFQSLYAEDSGVSFPHVAHFRGVSLPTRRPAGTFTTSVTEESPSSVTKIEYWSGDDPPS